MTIYYCSVNGGFYDTDFIDYGQLPDERFEISAAQRDFYLNAINNDNKEIIVVNGALQLRDKIVVLTWDGVRLIRNNLLSSSDYTQMVDYPGDKTAWATYRQLLRDIPQTYTDPNDVIWPSPPGA